MCCSCWDFNRKCDSAAGFNGCAYFAGCAMWSWSCCSLPSSTSRSKERAGLYEWSSTYGGVQYWKYYFKEQTENTMLLLSCISLCSSKHSSGLFLLIHIYFSLLTFSFRTLFQVPLNTKELYWNAWDLLKQLMHLNVTNTCASSALNQWHWWWLKSSNYIATHEFIFLNGKKIGLLFVLNFFEWLYV